MTADPSDEVTVPRADFDALLAVAAMFAEWFPRDKRMTAVERLRLDAVEDVLGRYGRR